MTKILSCLPTALLTLSCFAAAPSQAAESAGATPADYHLVQVLALSRHGIRAPLVNYGDALAEATPHHWPKWQTEGGLLTPKGGKVENHVGHYFHEWLAQNHLFGERGCPKGDAVFVYANSLPRTIDTAKFFLDGAFPGCDIPVNHQTAVGTMDPTFNPIITATVSENFKTAALNSIAQHAGPGGIDGLNTRLKPNYQLLEQVLDYSQSQACQRDKRCSLATQPSSVVLEQGKEPAITGPLRTGTGASDAFMLQYYEGFPLRDVGWGKITTPAQWR